MSPTFCIQHRCKPALLSYNFPALMPEMFCYSSVTVTGMFNYLIHTALLVSLIELF